MPNQPKTPQRKVRVEEELWRSAQAAAHNRGETVSDVIRRALRRYVGGDAVGGDDLAIADNQPDTLDEAGA